jgi:magnesium-protoporphyrin O-methyltransferase
MAGGECCGANVFGKRQAERQLRSYLQRGPDSTTRMLIDALKAQGVDGLSLLDIGGGIGAIALELFKSGVTTATEVDASPAYISTAGAEVERQGLTDRVECREGDFVTLAAEVPSAGIVTLDRVICCYPDMRALVSQSAARASKLYGAVYPRDLWWLRAARRPGNLLLRLLRNPLRLYVHRTAEVDTQIRSQGLAPRFRRTSGLWQIVVYARPASE